METETHDPHHRFRLFPISRSPRPAAAQDEDEQEASTVLSNFDYFRSGLCCSSKIPFVMKPHSHRLNGKQRDRRNRIWIVELLFEDSSKNGWTPSVGARLTRDEARKEELNWLRRNAGIKTRVVKYEAVQ